MVPRDSRSPCADPQLDVGVLIEVLRQLCHYTVAVDWHADDIPEHHSDNDWVTTVRCGVGDILESFFEFLHKEPIRGCKTRDVTPSLRPSHYLAHLCREPIVVA